MAKMIAYKGREVPFADLAKQLDITRAALRNRIRRNWPEETWGNRPTVERATITKCVACEAPVERNPAARTGGHGQYCSRSCAARTRMTRHGHGGAGHSPTYKTWHGMKQRCQNPNNRNYANYGGRGITVCKEWQTFEGFLRDMGERPASKTLDRIDVNGNYAPSNCRWISHKRQMNNMRKTLWITYAGERFSLQQLADKLGLDRYTLRRRILDMKWPEERWGDPPQPRRNQFTVHDQAPSR